MRMRTATATLALALALPLLPLTVAGADGQPGSGFASIALSATAHGQEWLFSPTTQVPAQMSVPYATSRIELGEGVGLSTVAWPGDTGASLGTTLVVGFGAPQQASILNDPAIATARSGAGPADVSNDTVPGATVRATATKVKATALAALDGTSAAGTTAGSSSSQTAVELTGVSSAVGTATSTVRDVTLGGVVHIAAVTSTASGTTDGSRGDARGSTTVTGVTVSGVGVTVDEKGVTVAGNGVVPPGAADAVTAALKQAQITLQVTQPTKTVTGGKVEYSTGALVATTPLGTLTLGGAELVLEATPGFAVDQQPPLPVTQPVATLPARTSVAPVLPSSGPAGDPGQLPAVVPAPTALPRTGSPLALVPLSVRTGYGWAWPVSGLLLSCVAGSGLLALSRRWLAPDLSGCPLERRPS